jgi:hypothetical protein
LHQAAQNTKDAESLLEMVRFVHRHLPLLWDSLRKEEKSELKVMRYDMISSS